MTTTQNAEDLRSEGLRPPPARTPGYVSWRHKTFKKWSEGGTRQTTHLTYHTPMNEEAPYTLCGRKIPGYSLTPGKCLAKDWESFDYIPDGPFHLCKRCEAKQ